MSHSLGPSTKAVGKAMRSGCRAASVFGARSVRIKITSAMMTVAIPTAPSSSPQKRMTVTVVSAENKALIVLLRRRIPPIRRWGRARAHHVERATHFVLVAEFFPHVVERLFLGAEKALGAETLVQSGAFEN